MLTDILMKHIGSFRPDRLKFFKHQRVNELPLVDDRLVTSFELMTFDQSTTDGNGQNMNHAATVECGYSKSELENTLILVSGDQLTMDRIRSLQVLKRSDTWGNRFNSALPLLGLFHLEMHFLKMFLKNRLGNASDISSVAGCNGLLHRERISNQLPDFWSAFDLIKDCLDAYVLSMVMAEADLRPFEEMEAFLAADSKCKERTREEKYLI
jgi:hypothetical protein